MAFLIATQSTVVAVKGQETRARKHPLSTYLDLRPALVAALPQSAPSWVESFDFNPATATLAVGEVEQPVAAGGIDRTKSVFRIRLQHPPKASDHLQMRVYYDDRATGPRPTMSVWNELGERMVPATPLGQGLGLPSSEALTVAMHGVNYLEIETPGDGSQMRGVFLSWLESAEVLQPADFPSQETVRQPFGISPRAHTRRDDASLFGTVTARLHGSKPLVLKAESAPAATLEFELERVPLMAVVTYEILGAAVDAVPTVTMNGRALGAPDVHLPDLADPAFQGEIREAEPRMSFRYTGWLRAQKMIPVDTLTAGLNSLTVRLSNLADSVAIRSVSIQLKYDWDKLDTVTVPASAAHETR